MREVLQKHQARAVGYYYLYLKRIIEMYISYDFMRPSKTNFIF